MEQTGAEIIIQALLKAGVRVVAGMPGGAVLPLYDALARSELRHVLVRHEQAAGFIAQGMARATGKVGVCFATSGPGATNLVTPLADAMRDSVPVVAITGQVPTALMGTQAFQEVDTPRIVRSLVKHASTVGSAEQLLQEVPRALRLAQAGRPGPVLLEVPKDVQLQRVALAATDRPLEPPIRLCREACADAIEGIRAQLARAQRPMVFVGGGLIAAGAHRELARLVDLQDLPLVSSLMGLGSFDPHDPRWLGMLGMHGAPYTNLALREADLLLALGVRFDDRATGKLDEFCPDARVVHVDVDPGELGRLRRAELTVQADAGELLRGLLPRLPRRARSGWLARIAELRRQHPLQLPIGEDLGRGASLLRALGRVLPDDAVVTTDVGQHQMWVAQHLPIRRPRSLLTSGGLGTMGFGLPAAMGAALATGAPVVCVSGDGSLMLSLPELATLAEQRLDVRILLLDNGHLGLVRQQQDLFYEQRHSQARFHSRLDFVAVARSLGLSAERLQPDASRAQLAELIGRPGPSLLHVPIEARDQVLPMVPPGAPNHRMLQ